MHDGEFIESPVQGSEFALRRNGSVGSPSSIRACSGWVGQCRDANSVRLAKHVRNGGREEGTYEFVDHLVYCEFIEEIGNCVKSPQ